MADRQAAGDQVRGAWNAVAGLRIILAHNYLKIDPATVWRLVENDLPDLELAIKQMSRMLALAGDRS